MSDNLMAWIHDDITWCMQGDCPLVNCMRNPVNMMDKTGLHSYAAFRQSEECPIFRMEQQADLERDDMTK